ncbi:MAG TPA: prohibitin family protein [Kofleriaceae bacterium]|nr:prohibitin family protein [Kofleriaceae bacterium]
MATRYLLAAIVVSSACSYAHIGSGEVGVIKTPDGVDPKPVPPGDWRIGMFDHATTYSVRSQEREERLDVQSADGLGITLDTSIRYHVIPEEAVALDRELGPDYYSVLIGPTLRSQARRVVGRFKPEEIYSTQRELIERQIREGIEAAIRGRHVQLEAVLVRNVGLPEQIQQKITDKLAAEQEALQMKFVLAKQDAEDQQKLMQARAEVERQRIEADAQALTEKTQAQAAADATRIAAQAAADAKRLDGKATADYEKAVAGFLTPGVLKLQEIDATKALAHSPNAKLVMMGGGGAQTLLDLRGVAAGKE